MKSKLARFVAALAAAFVLAAAMPVMAQSTSDGTAVEAPAKKQKKDKKVEKKEKTSKKDKKKDKK